MVDVETSRLDSGWEVLHAVENRVRLRAADTKTRGKLNTVAQQLRQLEGVRTVRTNEQTGSLVVTFEPKSFSLLQLGEVLQCEALVSPEARAETSRSDVYSQACDRVQSFIPPIVGLMTTRWLGINGWKAISTYLITTGLTRKVVDNLEFGFPEFLAGKPQKTAAEANGKLVPVVETDKLGVQPAKVAYKIVHEVPGRIRFQIPRIAQDLDYAKELQKLAAADDRIKSLRINRATASAVITAKDKMPLGSSDLIPLIQSAANTDPSKGSERQPPSQDSLEFITEDAEESPQLADTEKVDEQVKSTSELLGDATEEAVSADRRLNEETTNLPESKIADQVDEAAASASETTLDETEEAMVSESDPIKSTEPSNLARANPWSRFKSCSLATMLKLMANLPVEQANANA